VSIITANNYRQLVYVRVLLKLAAEDEERRRIRRERNKLAAARCRQRRVDLTNQLLAVSLITEYVLYLRIFQLISCIFKHYFYIMHLHCVSVYHG